MENDWPTQMQTWCREAGMAIDGAMTHIAHGDYDMAEKQIKDASTRLTEVEVWLETAERND